MCHSIVGSKTYMGPEVLNRGGGHMYHGYQDQGYDGAKVSLFSFYGFVPVSPAASCCLVCFGTNPRGMKHDGTFWLFSDTSGAELGT